MCGLWQPPQLASYFRCGGGGSARKERVSGLGQFRVQGCRVSDLGPFRIQGFRGLEFSG